MRPLTRLGFASALATLSLFGCGSVETGGGSSPPDITGDLTDLYVTTTGTTALPDRDSWISISAMVEQDGGYTTFPGEVTLDSKLRIAGVPEGPYLLVLTSAPPASIPGAPRITSFFATSARTLDLGLTRDGRPDTVAITKPTTLHVDATLTKPWQSLTTDGMGNITQPREDSLQLISHNASMMSTFFAIETTDGSFPADGATQVSWNIDARWAFAYAGDPVLVDGSKGDDFTLLHDVEETVGVSDGVDPWKEATFRSTREALHPTVPTMTNGGTSTVSGAFTPVKPSSFALDYKGSAFNALLPGVPSNASFVSVTIDLEPGTPQPLIGVHATLLDLFALGLTAYSNPACGGVGCDPATCASGCDLGHYVVPGDYAHTFSYGNPFDFGQEIASVYVSVATDVTALLPEGTPDRLRASFILQAPVSEVNGRPVIPTLGVPLAIKVNGQEAPYTQVTKGVGWTPELTWSPPTLGTPTSYQVTVVDFTDLPDNSGSIADRLNIARFDLTEPRVRIPVGLLQFGKFYCFLVAARAQDADDRAAPYKVRPVHDALSQTFTGIVTP